MALAVLGNLYLSLLVLVSLETNLLVVAQLPAIANTSLMLALFVVVVVVTGGLTKDLREYLTTRFAKGSVDHELQTTIRDNLYLRTVPVTTRPRRPGETDGLDYTFLSLDQFRLLEKNGSLLERGIYDGTKKKKTIDRKSKKKKRNMETIV